MSENRQDALLAAVMLAGAIVQRATGQPWLVSVGSLGMALRISRFQEDRRGILTTAGGCVLWFLLHAWSTRGLSRSDITIEVLAFSAFVVLFWVSRQTARQRITDEARQLDESRAQAGDLEERLARLRGDFEQLSRESDELTRLFSVTKSIGEVIRQEEVLDVIHESARTALKLPAYVLLLTREGVIGIRTQRGFDDARLAEAAFRADTPSLATWCLTQREPVLVDHLAADPRFASTLAPFRAMMVLPMVVRDEPVGALVAFDPEVRRFNRQDYARASLLARQLSLGIGKSLLYSRIEELSITDGLTHLYRHRYFMERLDAELERARRYSRPLALLLGDLDHFKSYNDRWGHPEGDEMLKLVSRVMEQEFKRPALLARYGGEEFAVLLPETLRADAVAQADRFRLALAAARLENRPDRPALTISIGAAVFPEDAQARADLLARADAALYRAKRAGRNRVES